MVLVDIKLFTPSHPARWLEESELSWHHSVKSQGDKKKRNKNLSKAIPSTWMHGQALPEPWAGLGGPAWVRQRGKKVQRGNRGGQGQKVDVRSVQRRSSELKRCLTKQEGLKLTALWCRKRHQSQGKTGRWVMGNRATK